ncbi:MAG: hypothetical protein OEV94_01240 [Deltaproteobacteria bacterium]|nr:hypothetical protein [Deltaproteobacteria bacterium]
MIRSAAVSGYAAGSPWGKNPHIQARKETSNDQNRDAFARMLAEAGAVEDVVKLSKQEDTKTVGDRMAQWAKVVNPFIHKN